jgi:hypothetical protein
MHPSVERLCQVPEDTCELAALVAKEDLGWSSPGEPVPFQHLNKRFRGLVGHTGNHLEAGGQIDSIEKVVCDVLSVLQ